MTTERMLEWVASWLGAGGYRSILLPTSYVAMVIRYAQEVTPPCRYEPLARRLSTTRRLPLALNHYLDFCPTP